VFVAAGWDGVAFAVLALIALAVVVAIAGLRPASVRTP